MATTMERETRMRWVIDRHLLSVPLTQVIAINPSRHPKMVELFRLAAITTLVGTQHLSTASDR